MLLGELFQIRDDYINLASASYENEEGFAEDLDEGKYSFPLIHLLNNTSDRSMIEHILHQRSIDGKMAVEVKHLVLDKMKEVKSLEATRETIQHLESQAFDKLTAIEEQSGVLNHMLRYFIMRLADFRELWFGGGQPKYPA